MTTEQKLDQELDIIEDTLAAIESLQQMSIEQIKALPDFMLEQMLQLGDVLPKMIIDKIKEALK